MRGPWRPRWELLSSGVFLVAIVVLVANDHVFKAAWPGVVTGKLSDIAGVAMMSVLLTAVTGQRATGFAATAVCFTTLKTVPAAAVWAAPLLGGVTLTDRTDVLAVLVLVPMWPWASVERWRVRRPRSGLPLRIAAVGAAVLATTATSCAESGVLGLAVRDGVVYADTSGGVWSSSDGGQSWDDTGSQSWDDEFADIGFGADRSCVVDRCYEYGRTSPPGTQVTASGAVTTVDLVVGDERSELLSMTDHDVDDLRDVVTVECGLDAPAGIAAIGADDGDVVMVAMGDAGVLRRSGAGDWAWVAVGEHGIDDDSATPLGVTVGTAAPGPGFDWPLWISRALVMATPIVAASLVRPIGALARRRRRDAAAARSLTTFVAVVSALLAVLVLVVAGGGDFGPAINVVGAVLIGGATAVALLTIAIVYGRPNEDRVLRPPDGPQRVG